MTDRLVHVVEPTLATSAGHCHSFVSGVCRAGVERGLSFRVWCARGARLPDLEEMGVAVEPRFRRRVRRLQALFLLRRLLQGPGAVLIPTAGRSDLLSLAFAARRPLPAGKAFLYFHWLRPSSSKASLFARVAARQPGVVVMGPTPSVAERLRSWGFSGALLVPYPMTEHPTPARAAPFRRLVYAGAARRDKGFARVVDLVGMLRDRGLDVPVTVQVSADHFERMDEETRQEVARLRRSGYRALELVERTLAPGEYEDLFRGAVAIQPYDAADFTDRVSGVTLDALAMGCPVVVPAGTWMARTAERFGAGRALDDLSPDALLSAALHIRDDYAAFSARALRGGRALREELSASRLAEVLSGGGEVGRG